jgi:hypothetical protein
MSRKLIVRLKGGLGNQLFCYASARRLALANDAELVLDAVTGFKYDYLYQRTYALHTFCIPARLADSREQMEPLGRIRRFIARKTSTLRPLNRRRYIEQVGVDFDPGILDLRLQEGTTYFDPFGQSERYFHDIREIIQQDLVMSAPAAQLAQDVAALINRSVSVALHVRWFDNGELPESSNMSLDYYALAIRRLLEKVGVAHFFLFSDRPQEASAMLSPLLGRHNCTVVQINSAGDSFATEFWLMRQCRHFVIGNSTFAWWAAWLGEYRHQGSHIFAPSRNVDPQHSVTAWGFPGLLPARWNVL